GPEPYDQNVAACRGLRQRPAQIERIPPRQQTVDFETPGQRQNVLKNAGLDLGNVDRLLLLIDAGLHAIVADAVAGRGAHRVVDRDDGERADRMAADLYQVHLGNSLVERAPCAHDPERALLELAALLLEPPRAGVLALVVAPDAVVGVIERAGEIGARIGQRKTVARATIRWRQLEHRDAIDDFSLDWNKMVRIDLVRDLAQNAAFVPLPPLPLPG